jgi:hypothetical protein
VSEEEYYITYNISLGKKATASEGAKIFVDKQAPIITGIADRQLEALEIGEVPDISFALSGVTISDNFTEMDLSDIIVTISENPEGGYLITYEAADAFGNTTIEQAIFLEEPIIPD